MKTTHKNGNLYICMPPSVIRIYTVSVDKIDFYENIRARSFLPKGGAVNARLFVLLLSVLSIGCEKISPFISDALWSKRMDVDQDGIPRPDDCDDRDPKIGIRVWYRDVDHDGLGAGEKIIACSMPTGATITNTDCDDANASAYPNATELCDTIDNNCNGATDELFKNLGASCGTGACSNGVRICAADKLSTTCSTLNNTSLESCDAIDNDCDGETDENLLKKFFKDTDEDTYGDTKTIRYACEALPDEVTISGDCDDAIPEIHPGVIEICNGIDDNCDGDTDEEVLKKFYGDADGDKCAHVSSPGTADKILFACEAPLGYISPLDQTCNSAVGDCNDQNPDIYAGATELCDGVDNDCNGQTDEPSAKDAKTLYADVDQDGYGNLLVTKKSCQTESGWSLSSDDCNDLDKFVHPNTVETCNAIDDDCDKQTDEGTLLTFFPDNDKDGYGAPLNAVTGCASIIGYVSNNADCNDQKKDVHPNAVELCDTLIDENCDGVTDNAIEANLWYLDFDKDGYGTSAVSLYACATPTWYVIDKTDCNDLEKNTYPNAVEICKDTIDNNCNGITDTDTQVVTWYLDFDQDGFGDAAQTKLDCVQPPGYVKNNSDCNDANLLIHPNAKEVCNNGVDDNCDGSVNGCILQNPSTLGNANFKLIGENTNDQSGNVVTFGDMNGDGKKDILSSSIHHLFDTGVVYLVHQIPNTKTASFATAGIILTGEHVGDLFGSGLFVAKINADAIDDLVVTAPGYKNAKGEIVGATYILFGPISTNALTQQTTKKLIGNNTTSPVTRGISLCDINGDSIQDLLLGAPSENSSSGTATGIIHIHLGPFTSGESFLQNSAIQIIGEFSYGNTGIAIDCQSASKTSPAIIAIGSPNTPFTVNEGNVSLIKGPFQSSSALLADAPTVFTTKAKQALVGTHVNLSHDFNGDGINDLLMSSPGNATNGVKAGALHIFYAPFVKGEFSVSNANLTILGEVDDNLGYWNTSICDPNNDQIPDLFVGAFNHAQNSSLTGGAYLLPLDSIKTKNILSIKSVATVFLGEKSEDRAGISVHCAGDINGDGVDDLAVGAFLEDTGGKNAGAAYIIFGKGL